MSRLIQFMLILSASGSTAAMAEGLDSSLIMGPFPRANTQFEKLRLALDTLKAMPKIRALTRDDTVRTLSLKQKIVSPEIETTKFQDYYKGLEVVGSMALHHEGAGGVQISDEIKEFDIDTSPRLNADEALSIARASEPGLELKSAPELKILPNEDGSARLVYFIDLKGSDYRPGADLIINANSGEIVANISHHLEIGSSLVELSLPRRPAPRPVQGPGAIAAPRIALVQVMQADSRCQSVDQNGAPAQLHADLCQQTVTNSTPQLSSDATARTALANAKRTLEYYKGTHNRDSYDNRGAPLVNVVHVGDKFDNAFWSTDDNIMGYGDGDGVEFGNFTGSLDVAGHELTHGITSQTAQLMMVSESGALNEAFSDYFGKMISNDGDWAMGKKIFLNPSSPGIRNLANPGTIMAKYRDENGVRQQRPFPSKMSEKFADRATCDGTNDRCWVHLNSTIPSHAMYLIHAALGRAKAEKLIFITLTQYMTSAAKFSTFKSATLRACQQLYDSTTCGQVQNQFAAVGI